MSEETKTAPEPGCGACLCLGTGPALTDMLRKLGPPEEARRHFDAARVEILKGIRTLIDARIEHLSRHEARGEKITVE